MTDRESLCLLLAECRGHLDADRILLLDGNCLGRTAEGEPDRATIAEHAVEALDELDSLISRIDAAIGLHPTESISPPNIAAPLPR